MNRFKISFTCKLILDLLFGGVVASVVAFLMRLDGNLNGYSVSVGVFVAISLASLLFVEWVFHLPWRSWRSSGMRDLLHLFKAIFIYGLLVASAMFLVANEYRIPRSIPFIDGVLTFGVMAFMRACARMIVEKKCKHSQRRIQPKRVLIAGAGEAGTMIAREMFRHPEAGLEPVGFVDDNKSKQQTVFNGISVHGEIKDIPHIAQARNIEELLIAIPSAEGGLVRTIVDTANKAGLRYRIVPGIYEVLSGAVSISHIRDVDVADLLGRDQVSLDMNSISRYITGKRVLVTGAGGSIGSEIVRQACGFAPSLIIMLGRGENSLFEAEHSLNGEFPDVPRETVVADVRDKQKIRMVFEKHRPQVVFHAAAHKHVPMMEKNPDQAILNNIGGTKVMAETALEFGVESFVNISTDKAVNPTSVMGATKRVAEMVVRDASSRAPENCSFVSVRFGNVLGSRGSVIPLFKEQIKRGGPVTVTHPEMTRYFMTIPEASQLVLQAAAMEGSGSVYVLDMGKPVKIKDLAEDLIQLSGFEPHLDIEITYTGIRPGEKLFEEILTSEEGTKSTHHDKIFIAPQTSLQDDFASIFEELLDTARTSDPSEIRASIKRIVPAFNNSTKEGKDKVEGRC